jgi:hypothetical protein
MLPRLLAVALTLAATAATADEPASHEWRRHFQRGLQLFDEHRYALAIDEFRAGYAIEPRGELLYALGQAQRLGGDCPSAIATYRAFLAGAPTPQQSAVVQQNIADCEETLRRTTITPPPPPIVPLPPPAVIQPPAPESPPDRPRIRGPHALPLLVGGIGAFALLGVGAGLRGVAGARYDDLATSCAPECAPDRWAGVASLERAGDALIAVAVVALAADVVLWVLDLRRGPR